MKHTQNDPVRFTCITFGKYKHKSLQQIADYDPGYIIWLYKNVTLIQVPKFLYEECVQKYQPYDISYECGWETLGSAV